MDYQFGDVVLVPFPFTNQLAAKQRPGVIVSNDNYHRSRRDVILMAITSQLHRSGDFGEVMIEDWQAAHLLKPSVVKPVIATLEQILIIKTLGRLSSRDQVSVRQLLASIVG